MNTPRIINKLVSVATLFKRSGNQLFEPFGLTVSLYIPLQKIDSDINTIPLLKKYIDGSSASITQKLNKLEKLNFIKRLLDPNDKRKWSFVTTKQGRDILKKIEPIYSRSTQGLFDGFSNTQVDNFLNILESLENKLK